jgi:hypothetical protein
VTTEEIKYIAKTVGIEMVDQFPDRESLVRTIQAETGFEDCFQESNAIFLCSCKKCVWSEDCTNFGVMSSR